MYEDFLDLISKLPPQVASASFKPRTHEFSVTFHPIVPVAPIETKEEKENREKESKKPRTTYMSLNEVPPAFVNQAVSESS